MFPRPIRRGATLVGDAGRIRKVFPSYWDALRFRFALGSRNAGRRPMPFRWKGMDFSARKEDYYGGVEDVFIVDEYRFLERLIADAGREALVVDAGANIGSFAIYALGINPSAEIHSIEPGPETFEILSANAASVRGQNWHVHHAALWNEDGQISFGGTGASVGQHVAETGGDGDFETVPAIRLDRFHRDTLGGKPITLIKMDIEGAELAVLEASHPVLENTGAMVIEIHPDACDQRAVLDILKRHFEHVQPIRETAGMPSVYFAGRGPVEMT